MRIFAHKYFTNQTKLFFCGKHAFGLTEPKAGTELNLTIVE